MTINSILQTIHDLQSPEGAFFGVSLRGTETEHNGSLFGTGLVATILPELAGEYPLARNLCARAVSYIASKQNSDGSFPYLDQYPPDLDDTALCTSAILLNGMKKDDGEFLANIVHLLTAAEISEGGPYNTWLAEGDQWQDVDVAVNANIAYLLSLLSVTLPNHTKMFDHAIETASFPSRYYHSPFSQLFFISRAYAGNQNVEAIELLEQLLKEFHTKTDTAFALCALSKFGADLSRYKDMINSLKESTEQPFPDPLYRERIQGNDTIFYANRAVSLSLIALAFHRNAADGGHGIDSSLVSFEKCAVESFMHSCTSVRFQEPANRHLAPLLSEPISKDALSMPLRFSRALGIDTDHPFLETIAVAHAFGWIGYKIIDSVLDSSNGIGDLPFAVFCTRSFASAYQKLFPDDHEFFSRIICQTERAFTKEYTDRLPLEAGSYSLSMISNTEPISWQKSFGHALPVLAILRWYGADAAVYEAAESFFSHFLRARQLHDDAHDYIEDLDSGLVTVVGRKILSRFKELHPQRASYSIMQDTEKFRRIFWYDCFPDVHEDIEQSIRQAYKDLSRMRLADPSYFESLLGSLDSAQQRAYDERERMLSFLRAY